MMHPQYFTRRLQLRTLDETEAEAVLDFHSRNRDFLQQWEPLRDQEYYSLAIHQAMLRDDTDRRVRGVELRLWLFEKENPAYVIGCVSLNNIIRGAFLSCHLGYKLDAEKTSRGYMTEALRQVVAIAFEELGLHRLEANIMPCNTASMKVVEKLGFRNEGLALQYLKINGRWEDHIHMVLLNDNL